MIPQIDLTHLRGSTSQRAEIATAVRQAYSEYGFGILVNHPISVQLTEQVFAQSRLFHELSESVKRAYQYQDTLRGYIPINASTLKSSKLADVKKPNQSQSFMMLNEPNEDNRHLLEGTPFGGQQVWPQELPDFKITMDQYVESLTILARDMVRIFAEVLNADQPQFSNFFANPQTYLRLINYPPRPADVPDDLYGLAPHSDYGCLTFLVQDDVGGLQLKRPDENVWIDVPSIPGAIIMNTGDMMTRWSNGMLRSTPHRVYNRSSQKPRYSVPFFFDCNFDTTIEPLPSCVSDERPAKFPPVNYGEYVTELIHKNYRI